MAVCSTVEILREARAKGFAVGAFEVWNLESVQAVIAAAEEEDLPIILQAGPLEIYHAGVEEIASLANRAIQKAKVPLALHLDHGNSLEMALEAIRAGFQSVMVDVSHLPYEENTRITREVAKAAHSSGLTCEGEIGRVGGLEGDKDVDDESSLTDPVDASRFVKETGVDFLAVAIGTRHGYYQKPPTIDLERLERIASLVEVPLVLHGGSDTPGEQVQAAIRLGIAKVNICTEFVDAFKQGFRDACDRKDTKITVPNIFAPAREKAKALVREKIRLFAMRNK